MRYITILLLTAFLSGCFDPALDTSTQESTRESYNQVLQSLPEDERADFDALVVYYLQEYEVGGETYQNTVKDLNGMTADEIMDVANEHKERMDKIMAEEMGAYQEYAQNSDNRPSPPSAPNFMKVSAMSKPEGYEGYKFLAKYVSIRSLVDTLTVQSLVANRGNCEVLSTPQKKQLPATIKYGEVLNIRLNHECDIIEAEIVTDQGSGTYSFNG